MWRSGKFGNLLTTGGAYWETVPVRLFLEITTPIFHALWADLFVRLQSDRRYGRHRPVQPRPKYPVSVGGNRACVATDLVVTRTAQTAASTKHVRLDLSLEVSQVSALPEGNGVLLENVGHLRCGGMMLRKHWLGRKPSAPGGGPF